MRKLWGKLKKSAMVGCTVFTGALTTANASNIHASKFVYEDLDALTDAQLVAHSMQGFEHDTQAHKPTFFKEMVDELGWLGSVTGKRIDNLLDNRFDEMTPLQRIQAYMLSAAHHIGDPYNNEIPTGEELTRLVYRGRSDSVIAAAKAYKFIHPELLIAQDINPQTSMRSIAVKPLEASNTLGLVDTRIPDRFFLKTDMGPTSILATITHEVQGHTLQSPDYQNIDIVEDHKRLKTHDAIDDADEADNAELANAANEGGIKIALSTKEETLKHYQYMNNKIEIEPRLAKMKQAYFLATGVAVNSPDDAFQMLGAFGVKLDPMILSVYQDNFVDTSGYQLALNSALSEDPNDVSEALLFFKEHNSDVRGYCELVESGFGLLDPQHKREQQLKHVKYILQITPGLAANETSPTLGTHKDILQLNDIDFRDFMPGAQPPSGPDARSMA